MWYAITLPTHANQCFDVSAVIHVVNWSYGSMCSVCTLCQALFSPPLSVWIPDYIAIIAMHGIQIHSCTVLLSCYTV